MSDHINMGAPNAVAQPANPEHLSDPMPEPLTDGQVSISISISISIDLGWSGIEVDRQLGDGHVYLSASDSISLGRLIGSGSDHWNDNVFHCQTEPTDTVSVGPYGNDGSIVLAINYPEHGVHASILTEEEASKLAAALVEHGLWLRRKLARDDENSPKAPTHFMPRAVSYMGRATHQTPAQSGNRFGRRALEFTDAGLSAAVITDPRDAVSFGRVLSGDSLCFGSVIGSMSVHLQGYRAEIHFYGTDTQYTLRDRDCAALRKFLKEGAAWLEAGKAFLEAPL